MFYNRHTQEKLIENLIDAIRRSSLQSSMQQQENQTSLFQMNVAAHANSSMLFIQGQHLNQSAEIGYDLDFYSKNLGPTNNYCVESWSNPSHKRVYILILFCLEFVLPCLCMLITYIWIIRFLKMQHNRMTHYEMLRKKLIQKERPHQKNCKLLSSLCLTFIVCCLPLSLFNIITDFIINTQEKQTVIYWPLTILTTLELMNTVLSPLLYGWMNHNFRIEINEKLSKLKIKYKRANTFEEVNEKGELPKKEANHSIKCFKN